MAEQNTQNRNLRVIIGAASHRGLVRPSNQDALAWPGPQPAWLPAERAWRYSLEPEALAAKGVLMLVADGVGGREGGETASQLAASTIPGQYYAHPADDPAASLAAAFQGVNQQLCEAAPGMATTVVGLVVQRKRAIIANVGDSRAYLLRGTQLQLLTQDHSWAGEQLRRGRLSAAEASVSDLRHRISRFLGDPGGVEVDLFQLDLAPDDRLLLCSDGLSAYVEGRTLGREIFFCPDPGEAAQALVRLANAAGGQDNVTALVVALDLPGPRPWPALSILGLYLALALVGLAIGLGLAFWLWG